MTIGHYSGDQLAVRELHSGCDHFPLPLLSSSIPVTRAPKEWGGKNSGFGRYGDSGFTPLPALAASDAPFPLLTLKLPVCMACLAGACCQLRPSVGSSHGFILLLPGREIIDDPVSPYSPSQLISANLRRPNQVSLIRVLPRFFMGL